MKVFPSFLQLHGKTYDYKIPYTSVLRLFLLPHKDQRFMFFVVSVKYNTWICKYSWTSLQWLPWGQSLPAFVKRWPLLEVKINLCKSPNWDENIWPLYRGGHCGDSANVKFWFNCTLVLHTFNKLHRWILSTTGNFTHSVKDKSSTLGCDRCYALLIFMTALWRSST